MKLFGARGAVQARMAAMQADCDRLGGAGSRVVGFGGWIGGVGKTTAAAATTQLFSDMMAAPVDALDANPDKPLLRRRLLGGVGRGRLLEFIDDLDRIHTPMDLAGYLDSVGRLHLLHKDGVHTDAVAAITQAQWTAVIAKLTGYAQLITVDGGTSQVSPAAKAVLSQVDHFVFCMRLDPTVFNPTAEGLAELTQAGFEDLVATSTMVITTTDAQQKLTPLLQDGIAQFREGVGRVVLVPYDHGAGSVGQVRVEGLKPATQLAYLEMAEHITEVFTRPRRAEQSTPIQIPASASVGSTPASVGVSVVERSLLRAVPRAADEAESAS